MDAKNITCNKILITGNAGAGKTTFAVALGEKLKRNVIHLDRLIWKENWQLADQEERRKIYAQILTQDRWLVDGVSRDLCCAADLVIFMDIPRWYCLSSALLRSCKHLFHPRAELAKGCVEYKIIFRLIKLIWQFPKRCIPNIKTCKPDLIFKSRQDAWKWLNT